jgi:anti-anti-sigma factor
MTNLAVLREPGIRVAHRSGHVAVVSLVGEHDIATAWELRNVLAVALEQGSHLVVDLSETEFIDSSIIHVLFESEQLALEHGRRLTLQLQTDARAERALEISGMLEALPAYGTRAEAIDAVRKTPDRITERSAAGVG